MRWLPFGIWVAVILGLSSVPSLGPARFEIAGADKLVHVVEYAVLGFLFARAARLEGRSRLQVVCAAAALGIVVGTTDELYQRTVPGRTSDVRDVGADLLGAAAGGALWQQYRRARTRNPRGGA